MATIDTHPEPSLIHIIKDLRDDTLRLFRQEVALAKREVVGKFSTFGRNSVLIGVGAVLGLYSSLFIFLFLNNLARAGLVAAGMPPMVSSWLAPLLLGMLIGIAALILVLKALKSMRKQKMVPDRTLRTLREDKDWVKGKMKG